MELTDFTAQIDRLSETYGKNTYPPERSRLLWRVFSNASQSVFREAVDELILTCRTAPMLREFEAAVEEARTREKARLRSGGARRASFVGVLLDAAERDAANEFARACVRLLDQRVRRALPDSDWEQGLAMLRQASRNTFRCLACEDSGVQRIGAFAYRCRCEAGFAHDDEIPLAPAIPRHPAAGARDRAVKDDEL